MDVVAEGRKLSLKKAMEVADGRIFTASQARDLGLVDQLGYLDDALELARVKAGLDPGARVVTYHRPGGYKPDDLLPAARPGHGGAPSSSTSGGPEAPEVRAAGATRMNYFQGLGPATDKKNRGASRFARARGGGASTAHKSLRGGRALLWLEPDYNDFLIFLPRGIR